MIYLFHNPKCSKSRDCYAFLHESRVAFQVINYLEKPPTFDQLKLILVKLAVKPIDIVRKKEKLWISNYKNKHFSDDEILTILVQNPILIERPIVINGNKAIIARPFDIAKSVL